MILKLDRKTLARRVEPRRRVDPETRKRMDEAARRSAVIEGPRVDHALQHGLPLPTDPDPIDE